MAGIRAEKVNRPCEVRLWLDTTAVLIALRYEAGAFDGTPIKSVQSPLTPAMEKQ
jgi:hypothetical protein